MKSRKLAVFLITIAISAFSYAQSNLAELLDQGGKKMSGAAVKTWLLGGTFSGLGLTNGFPLQIHYKDDGSFTGSVSAPSGPVGISGKWKVDDDGKMCVQLAGAPRPDAQWDCAYFYALGDRYFVSESDTDRAAKVGARTVKP